MNYNIEACSTLKTYLRQHLTKNIDVSFQPKISITENIEFSDCFILQILIIVRCFIKFTAAW